MAFQFGLLIGGLFFAAIAGLYLDVRQYKLHGAVQQSVANKQWSNFSIVLAFIWVLIWGTILLPLGCPS